MVSTAGGLPCGGCPLPLAGGVLFGGLEEVGWRGPLQPLLQARRSGLAAAVLVGVVGSVWHAPWFLLASTTQAATSWVWFTIGGIALAVLFAWVWNRSRGNLLLLARVGRQLGSPPHHRGGRGRR